MAGPWDKYSQKDGAALNKEGGPWSKYKDASEAVQSGPTETQSKIRGAIAGFTGNFDDEITGGLGAVGRVFGVKNLGSAKPFDPSSKYEMADEPLSVDEIVRAYRENRDSIRDEKKLDMEANPVSTIAGNVAGAIVSPLSKIGITKGAEGLSKAQALIQAAKAGAKVGSIQGGIYGLGGSDSDLTKGDVGGAISDTALNAAVGFGVGASVPVAVESVKKLSSLGLRGSKFLGKKAFSSLSGISEENAGKYLARSKEINAAPEFAQIKDQVDDSVAKISDALESGKIKLADAKAAIGDLKTQVRNQMGDAKVDAREAVRRSDDMLKDASAKLIQPLKDTRAPTELASEVVSAVSDLKRGLSEKSGVAWNALESSNQTLSNGVIKAELTKAMSTLKVGGKSGGVIGQSAESALTSLQKLRDQLDLLPKKLKMSEIKQIIQGLDRDIDWKGGAGEFMDAASQEKYSIRKATDAFLKRNAPEYEQAMAPVAKDAKLLGELSSFGEERSAIGKLGQIANSKGKLDREMLARLEESTGRKGAFTNPIDQYTRAQAILKDPAALEKLKRSRPEFSAYRQASVKLAKMKPNWTRDQIERALSTSKEARALSQAEEAFKSAQSKYDPISSLKAGNTQSKLESFGKPSGEKIETRKTLEALEAQTGKKFIQDLDDRGVLNSFSKSNTSGSRNTLFGGVIGFGMGGMYGAGIGASVGRVVLDQYGPKVGKAILDGMVKIKNNPSIKTIRSLNVPDSVKQELEREFKLYMVVKNTTESSASRVASNSQGVDREPSQLKGYDKWASSGASKLGLDESTASQLMQSKQGKQLLIEASDLPLNSKKLSEIKIKIQGLGR